MNEHFVEYVSRIFHTSMYFSQCVEGAEMNSIHAHAEELLNLPYHHIFSQHVLKL